MGSKFSFIFLSGHASGHGLYRNCRDVRSRSYRAFPKARGGLPIIRIRVFWGLYWEPLISETTM